MNTLYIAVIVGSFRRDSLNQKLADALIQLAPPELSFSQVKFDDLPPYNQDDDEHQAASVLRVKSQIQSAHGLLFVTPEYNRSIPGVLKNLIDHASRPYGQSVWAGKPAGVLGASVGVLGTALAQQHLRNILAYLNVPTMGQPEAFIHAKEGFWTEDGHIGTTSLGFVQGWMDQYVSWLRLHVQGKTP
ncbi:NADPH-dependent FMN reductase [Limnohabitans planktonicus]|uniref:NADPH-dependent FMN reductase n=1 Tax=Limnohabitans planktonicus II-D5 TaxID=1293045 RepID=A0A2T7UA51_9BURK|nr:NAD(P)H-dependent oxidoreductase [Limnohabitans planktonicus]PVE41544.1 NADPH-dependent FMN reductase [Limnohabitans planktonicus II-D5]|eukprot:gene2310-2264_t